MCVHIALVSRRRSLNSTTPSPSNIPPKCHTLNIGKLLIFATLPATGRRAQNRRLNTDHMCVHIALVSRRRSLNSTTPSPSNIPPKCRHNRRRAQNRRLNITASKLLIFATLPARSPQPVVERKTADSTPITCASISLSFPVDVPSILPPLPPQISPQSVTRLT
jgi:hypothetical protein